MRILIGEAASGSGSRIISVLFGTCSLLLMSACGSGNPDALTGLNSEQAQADVDLNDAMNAIAAAPANSADPAASTDTAPVPAATAQLESPSAPVVSAEVRRPRHADLNANTALAVDEQDALNAAPEEASSTSQATEPQSNEN